MVEKKFGIFALLVILLSISGNECKRSLSEFSNFLGGFAGAVRRATIVNSTNPNPKPQSIDLYSAIPTHATPPIYNPPRLVPVVPITPGQIQTTNTAPGYNQGAVLQSRPAYPVQAPILMLHNSSPIRVLKFHPSFYGFIGVLTFLLGKEYQSHLQ